MSEQTDLALTKGAMSAFIDALAKGLHPVASGPLKFQVAWYKPVSSTFGSRRISGSACRGLLTTADFAWSRRARFSTTVGHDDLDQSVVAASMNGFGIMEGQLGEILAVSGDVTEAAATLSRKAVGWIKGQRSGFGDW